MKQCLACSGTFYRAQVDKCTWCDLGSSDLPAEPIQAFPWAR